MIVAAQSGEISLTCRSCGYAHEPAVIAEHLRLGRTVLADVTDHRLDLRQRPSVTQTLDWARTLLALGAQDLDAGLAAESLPMLLAHRSDIELAAAELGLPG